MEHTIILNSGQKVEVLFCDEVSLDIDCSLRYIKSGHKEISDYVQNTAKPQLDGVIAKAKEDMSIQIKQGIKDASDAAETTAFETIKDAKAEISGYVEQNIYPILAENLQETEKCAAQSLKNAARAELAQTQSELQASSAAGSAKEARNWADNAETIVKNLNIGFGLFDFKFTDHQINDMSWLRSDTFSWQSGETYEAAYNKLLEEYNAVQIVETEGDITFKRTASGFKIAAADQEEAVLNLYNAEGVAWYYILDSENTRFKLPRTQYGFSGLRDAVGNYVPESLPNIRGKFWSENSYAGFYANKHTGAFSAAGVTAYYSARGGSDGSNSSVKFDASLASPTYQDNAPVQERSTQMYLYFYVGTYDRPAIEQTAGIKAEMFNSKADINLSNTNPKQSFKDMAIKWQGLDYSAQIDLSSTSFEVPVSGMIYAIAQAGGNVKFSLTRDGVTISDLFDCGTYSGDVIVVPFPVLRGDVLVFAASLDNYRKAKYIPFIGANE